MNVTELGAGKRLPQFYDGGHSIGPGQRADFSPQPESYPHPPAIPYGSINIALNAMKRAMNGEATKNADIKTNGQSIMLTSGERRHFVMLGTRDGRPIVRYSLVLGDGNGGSTTNFRTADIADLPLNATREELDRFVRALPIDRRQNYPDTLESAQNFTRELLNVGQTLYEEHLNHRPTSLANAAHSAAGFVDMTAIEFSRKDPRQAHMSSHSLAEVRAAAKRHVTGRVHQSPSPVVHQTEPPTSTPRQPERHTNPTETVLGLFQGLQLRNIESPALDTQGIISLVPDANDLNQTSRWVYTDGSVIRMMARQQNGIMYVVSISRGENNRIITKVRTITPEDRLKIDETCNSVHAILSRNDTTPALIAPEGSENTVLQGLYRLFAADLSTSRNNVNSSRKITLERFMSTIQTLNPFIAEQARQRIPQAPQTARTVQGADTAPSLAAIQLRTAETANIEKTIGQYPLFLEGNILPDTLVLQESINGSHVTAVPILQETAQGIQPSSILFRISTPDEKLSTLGILYLPQNGNSGRVVYFSDISAGEQVGMLVTRQVESSEYNNVDINNPDVWQYPGTEMNPNAIAQLIENVARDTEGQEGQPANISYLEVTESLLEGLYNALNSNTRRSLSQREGLERIGKELDVWTHNSWLENNLIASIQDMNRVEDFSQKGRSNFTFHLGSRTAERSRHYTARFHGRGEKISVSFDLPEMHVELRMREGMFIFTPLGVSSNSKIAVRIPFAQVDNNFAKSFRIVVDKMIYALNKSKKPSIKEVLELERITRELPRIVNSQNTHINHQTNTNAA